MRGVVGLALVVMVTGCGRIAFDVEPSGHYVAAVLADGPIGYWRLDEPAGPIARDSTGRSPGGQYFGGIALGVGGAIESEPDLAATFDGATGFVDTHAQYDFSGRAPLSIEAWIATTVIDSTYRHVFTSQHRPSGEKEGVAMLTHAGSGIVFERFVADAGVQTQAAFPIDGLYHHVVATYDGALMTLYVDDALAGMLPDARDSLPIVETELIGDASSSEDFCFNGPIDEVALYDHALTAARIHAHYVAAFP